MSGNHTNNMGDGNYNERLEGDYIDNRKTYINNVAPDQQNPPNNLQFTGTANFVGRQHELTVLHENLLRTGTVALTAVAGMGGVGKTELATQYARKHEADYPGGICWLNARESDLAASIVQFAQLHMKLEVPQQDFRGRVLNLIEQVKWCWQHWQPTEGLALIILDDVTSIASCRDFLPKANRFRVLITTRLRNLDPNIEEISLDVLSPQEALQLMTAQVGALRVQKEQVVAKQLCEWLGYLPLGLELVGRYVAKKPPNYKLAQMLERLKAQRLEDEAINRDRSGMQQTFSTAQRGVLAAFELSWLEISVTTQLVAVLLSLFAPNILAWEWVESASELLNWSSTSVEIANEQLSGRHLIQWVLDTSGEYKIRIHPLIREFLLVKLAASEQVDDLKRAFAETMVAIAKLIPYSPTQELITRVKDAIPHLTEVAQNMADAVSNENLIWVFAGNSRFYAGQGLYANAEPWLKQCLLVVKSRIGEEHPDFATSLSDLAYLYTQQGRYTEAEPLFQQALELRRSLLGELHPDFATSLNNLAYLYKSQGKYTEAEPLFQQALELRRSLLGELHPDFATSLNNLAYLYKSQGRYTEAEPLFQQALGLRRSLHGKLHPRVATSLNNLAELYSHQGRYTEAEPLFQQALELRRSLHGKSHPRVATSLNNLAELYSHQGRYTEAEPLFQQALEIRRSLLRESHPDVAISLKNLGNLYNNQGRYAEAVPLYQQALEIASKSLGVSHPSTVTIHENLQSLCNKYA